MKNYTFTSESVSEGHPDKIADQISDAILDAALMQDIHSKVACETLVKTDHVIIAGEISTRAVLNIEQIVREVIHEIGYNETTLGFDPKTCRITLVIGQQSLNIAQGINRIEQGAGDQGLMFGYACHETPALMPAPIFYAHRLVEKHAQLRRTKHLPWLKPDAKSQISFEYRDGKPYKIKTIVLSTHHAPEIDLSDLRENVIENIVKPVIPVHYLDQHTQFLINPAGPFTVGGPQADTGLTGRKIIVDTYGGFARHGGGCFSGKDPSKVDRSAAYIARKIAKHIVALQLATHCEIQLSYAIGKPTPTSICIDTFNTGRVSSQRLLALVEKHFDLSVKGIIQELNLLRPIYQKTANYGHFGRLSPEFTWEQLDKLEKMQFKS